jgi:hypothetical protein
MNIFYLDHNQQLCAEWSVDSHCVKMILESAQLLSTAHRVIDGSEYIDDGGKRKVKRWRLDDDRNVTLYSATHVNHPSAVWCRETDTNYLWLWSLLNEYCKEYTYRYGKTHKVEADGLLYDLRYPPHKIKNAGLTEPPSAMDPKYIISKDPIINYRNYYKVGKIHLHKWKNREAPKWIKEA